MKKFLGFVAAVLISAAGYAQVGPKSSLSLIL